MSCYLRHLKTKLKAVGVEITDENKKEIDKAVHKLTGIKYKNCPHAWREFKKKIANDKDLFKQLKKMVKS